MKQKRKILRYKWLGKLGRISLGLILLILIGF